MAYIDADKIYRYIDGHTHLSKGKLLNFICEHRTADVEEVRHGEWIQSEYDRNTFVCSECGKHIKTATEPRMYYPYCHCGAKMNVRYTE